MEGFSIREYASRMRSIEVVRCWPFDETTSEGTVKSMLPPITIKKFSWWLDELEDLQKESAENLDNFSKTKRNKTQEKEETSLRCEEGKGLGKVKSLKGKSKAPKKRSIVEIFAVAPQVERVSSSDEEQEVGFQEEDGFFDSKYYTSSHHKGIYWRVKGKRNEKKKINKSKQVIKKIKKKKKAYNGVDSSSFLPNKGTHSKLKAQSQGKAIERLNSSYSKSSENDIHDCPIVHKRRPKSRRVDADRRTTIKVFNLTEENENPPLPKNDNLKNPAKQYSCEQSAECVLQDTIQVNDHYGKQKTAKHVTFSKDDDLVSLRRKPFPSAECFKLQKSSHLSSGDFDHERDVRKDLTDVESSGIVDISNRVENELDKEMGTCSRSIISDRSKRQSINEEMFYSSLREAPRGPMYACPPGLLCLPPQEHYNSPSIRFTTNSTSSTYGTRDPRFTPVCFNDFSENNNGCSFSYILRPEKVANKMPQASLRGTAINDSHPSHQASLRGTAINDSHPSHYRSFAYLSPKDVPPTSFSEHVLPERVITGIDKDFVGLPLNSHGELIALTSNAKGNFDQMMNSSTSEAPSTSLSMPRNSFSKGTGNPSEGGSLDGRTFSKDQLNFLPVETYAKEKPFFVLPSKLDITEPQSSGVTNLDLDLIKNDDHSLHSQKFMGKEDKRVQISDGTEKIQSTIRLMGKEFIVGGRGLQGFEDEQILDKFQCGNKSIRNILIRDWNELSLGKPGETLICPSEITTNHGPESWCTVPRFGHETNLMHHDGAVVSEMSPVQKVYPSLSPCTSHAVCNSDSSFLEPSGRGYESQVLSSSAIQLKNKQNLPHARRSAFRFPFMHPDLEGHIQSSCNQSPLCFDVSENGSSVADPQTYGNICSNHWTKSPLSHKPEVFYMQDPFFSGLTLQSSVAPASLPQIQLCQHALTPVYPGVVPFASAKTHGNPKYRDRMKSKIGTRGPDDGKKAKRQISAVSNVPFKPFKVPGLGSQEGSGRAITKSTILVNLEGDVKSNGRAFESCSAIEKSQAVICKEQRVCPWVDSYNEVERLGPTKLTAGAKHILKASQRIDQSSSWSIYPDIPLGRPTAGFRFLESENSRKIYRF